MAILFEFLCVLPSLASDQFRDRNDRFSRVLFFATIRLDIGQSGIPLSFEEIFAVRTAPSTSHGSRQSVSLSKYRRCEFSDKVKVTNYSFFSHHSRNGCLGTCDWCHFGPCLKLSYFVFSFFFNWVSEVACSVSSLIVFCGSSLVSYIWIDDSSQ